MVERSHISRGYKPAQYIWLHARARAICVQYAHANHGLVLVLARTSPGIISDISLLACSRPHGGGCLRTNIR